MKRSLLLTAGVGLGFALLLTVGSAWAIAALSAPRVVRLASLSLANRVDPERWRQADGTISTEMKLVGRHESFGLDTQVHMAPEPPVPAPPATPERWQRRVHFEIGWPARSFVTTRVESHLPAEYALRHKREAMPDVITVDVIGGLPLANGGFLPTAILWRGFGLNMLVWWTILCAGALLALRLRRRRIDVGAPRDHACLR